MKTKEIRIPRDKGITERVIWIRSLSSGPKQEKAIKALRETIINNYVQNNLTINGQSVKLYELANYLGISTTTLIRQMNREMLSMMPSDLNDLYRVALSQTLKEVMETHSLNKSQAYRLLGLQGNNYVPFLSREVNSALGNLIVSTGKFLELTRILAPSNANQINIQNNQLLHSNNQVLSTNDAIKLIDSKRTQSLLENTDEQNRLLEAQGLESLPIVVATKQQGTNDDGTLPSKRKRLALHETRREVEGELDSQ